MKVISGRPRDLEDVAGVIRRNRGFDRSYVGGWLKQFDSELDGDFSAVFDEIATKKVRRKGGISEGASRANP